MPELGPAPVLSVLVGAFHTGLYLLVRGRVGLATPVVLVVAVLGAFAGQAVAERLGDPFRVGDYGLLWASLFAWAGIVVVAAVSLLAPAGDRP